MKSNKNILKQKVTEKYARTELGGLISLFTFWSALLFIWVRGGENIMKSIFSSFLLLILWFYCFLCIFHLFSFSCRWLKNLRLWFNFTFPSIDCIKHCFVYRTFICHCDNRIFWTKCYFRFSFINPALSKTPFTVKIWHNELQEFQCWFWIRLWWCLFTNTIAIITRFIGTILQRENMNCTRIRRTSYKCPFRMKRYGIYLCIFTSSTKFLKKFSLFRTVDSNNSTFLTSCS